MLWIPSKAERVHRGHPHKLTGKTDFQKRVFVIPGRHPMLQKGHTLQENTLLVGIGNFPYGFLSGFIIHGERGGQMMYNKSPRKLRTGCRKGTMMERDRTPDAVKSLTFGSGKQPPRNFPKHLRREHLAYFQAFGTKKPPLTNKKEAKVCLTIV